jgi:hypothetical protein
VAEALNRLLYEIAIKCAKEEGIRNYYDIGVIGSRPGRTAPCGLQQTSCIRVKSAGSRPKET